MLKAGHAYSLYACHYQVQHPGERISTGGRDGTMAVWADEEVLKQLRYFYFHDLSYLMPTRHGSRVVSNKNLIWDAHAQTNRQCKRVLSPFITVLAPYPGYRAGTVPSVNTVISLQL